MKVINIIQNSPEWHAHRRNHLNASDAPAMMGASPYKTRDQLLHEMATGLTKEVDAGTQKRFDDGHKFEALARPLAEKIIGDELSPTVGVDGKFSASFDGITFAGDIIFEHKTLNDSLRSFFETGASGQLLPDTYIVQMEQQLMISGAEKCLFMASKWQGETLVESKHVWYHSEPTLRQEIIDGWAQFEKDLAAYVPPTIVEKVEAETVTALPVPSVVVRGEITASNLEEITPKFDTYLGSVNTELTTDQDFADAEANAKNCRETAERIKALRGNIIAQMVTVNEASGVLENYEKAFNALALRLEKAVKEQKEKLKTTAILSAQLTFNTHVSELEAETKPIRLNVSQPDFAGAIKGIKTVASMHSRINDALAAGKMNADAVARDIRAKQAWLKENADGYQFLFSDIHTIITKPLDDLQTLAKLRISEHQAAEAAKAKQMQEQAEAAARAKIEQEQRDLAAQAEKQRQAELAAVEQRAQAEAAQQSATEMHKVGEVVDADFEELKEPVTSAPVNLVQPKTGPTKQQIISLVSKHFRITEQDAQETIIEFFGLSKAA